MKKAVRWSLTLAILIMLVYCCSAAMAASSGSCGDNATWTLSDDGVLTISGTGPMKTTFDNAPWESQKSMIKSVIVKKGITTIGYASFNYCSNLTNVTLPDTLTIIDDFAFSYCTKLSSIDVPDSVRSIGNYAFWNTSLTSFTIPTSLREISGDAFDQCYNLKEIVVPNQNQFFSVSAGVLYNKDKTTLIKYFSRESSFTVPQTVKEIGSYAFSWCTLQAVSLPDGLLQIGSYAFNDCKNLTSIQIPDSVQSIGYAAFWGCPLSGSLSIPFGISTISTFSFSHNNTIF